MLQFSVQLLVFSLIFDNYIPINFWRVSWNLVTILGYFEIRIAFLKQIKKVGGVDFDFWLLARFKYIFFNIQLLFFLQFNI